MTSSHIPATSDQDRTARRRAQKKPDAASRAHEARVSTAHLQASVADVRNATPATLLRLQRTYGNQAVQALIQRKLTVGAAHDRYEQEADRVARQVMRAPEAGQPAPPTADTPAEVQAKPASAAGGFEVDQDFERRLSAASGSGRPIPDGTRDFMETRMGADFSGVRLHTGSEAARLNREVSAQAFTHGRDIYLGQGHTDVESSAGKQLLAHELTHTVQQGAVSAQRRTIQRKLTLDGAPVLSNISDTQLAAIRAGLTVTIPPAFQFEQKVVAAMIDHGTAFNLSTAQVVQVITDVYALYTGAQAGPVAPQSVAAQVHDRLLATEMAPAAMAQKLNTSTAGIDDRNALAFNQFMTANPQFGPTLKTQKLAFKFGSREAKGLGGMYARQQGEGGTVHLEGKVGAETPDVFMRTLVHEIGHGTFQQLLLKDQLSAKTSKGKLGDLRARHQQILASLDALSAADAAPVGGRRAVNLTGGMAQMAPLLSEKDTIERELKTELAKFTDDGKVFYDAWEILRQNNGQHLLGVDLGSVATAASRKTYQADTFEEFCAESFMHLAVEGTQLQQHIAAIDADPGIAPAIKQAWHQIEQILEKYKYIILQVKWQGHLAPHTHGTPGAKVRLGGVRQQPNPAPQGTH